MFYCEEKRFDGKWMPVIYQNAPSRRKADGTPRLIREGSIKEIDARHEKHSLAVLKRIYGSAPEFKSRRAS